MRSVLLYLLVFLSYTLSAQLSSKLEELKSNVVYIQASPKDKSASPQDAFGFIIGGNQSKVYIVTANHTFDEFGVSASELDVAVQFYRFTNAYTATIQRVWDKEDLALLVVNLDIPLKWKTDIADFNPGKGQIVSTIGFNRDWTSPMKGSIQDIRTSDFNIVISKKEGSLNRGNSGGPVINEKGIVGMILRTEGTGDVSEGLSLNRIRDLLSQFSNVFQLKPDTEGMVYIQGGKFMMGDRQAEPDARDVHEVVLNTFYLMPTELSFEEYEAFCTNSKRIDCPSDKGWGSATRPVMSVSWLDAIEYCNWRSEKAGKQLVYSFSKDGEVIADFRKNGYRLPTEAEWEYAARSGVFNVKSLYANGKDNLTASAINYEKLGKKQTWPNTEGDANELGLKNMSGNVAEWCWDYYSNDFYRQTGSKDNPKGPGIGSEHVARGGSWNDKEYALRVYARLRLRSNVPYPTVGFRLARNAE